MEIAVRGCSACVCDARGPLQLALLLISPFDFSEEFFRDVPSIILGLELCQEFGGRTSHDRPRLRRDGRLTRLTGVCDLRNDRRALSME